MKLDFGAIAESLWRHKIITAIGGLVLLGGVLFGIHSCSNYFEQRSIDKMKANVNAGLKTIEGIQANINLEKQAEAAALERVRIETKDYLDSVNASNAARLETDRAIANMQSAVNANRPVGITAAELEKRLTEIGH